MKDENWTGLVDEELEMMFKDNVSNFMTAQKSLNKETDRFCKEATKLFAKLSSGYANVVQDQILMRRKIVRMNIYMIVLLALLLWSIWV